MLVADDFLGTVEDPDLRDRLDAAALLRITVDETERRRSRFRTTAEDGTDVGVVVARELEDGDVLEADDRLVVVELEPVAAMVLDFRGTGGDADALTTAVELGHAVGNRHWDLAVEDQRVYLPAAESRERMESTVGPHLPDGVGVGYDEVPPTLFDGERGHGDDGHSHGDHSHSHAHDDGHGHSHGSHGHGTDAPVRSLDHDADEADAGGEES
jgi:urease accessory protein